MMGMNTRSGSVTVKTDYSLTDIAAMQRFLAALERSKRMKMTSENMHFWLVAASDMNDPELFSCLAETLASSSSARQEAGIDMWVEAVNAAIDRQSEEQAAEAKMADEKIEAITAMLDDE
jgi:hypothetical protein|tara:strand:+ start:98 stop:457 length:360 start_codon:yes stop_codon:yes gene_type:complete